MNNTIKIETDNGELSAYFVKPNNGNGAVVVCLQEIFGVNVWMKNLADELADHGYIAIVPDLFWRIEENVEINGESDEDFAKAFELYGKFDAVKSMIDINNTIKYARNLEDNLKDKVGTMGFCLGGYLAYMSSIKTESDANISYYGVGIEENLSQKNNIKKPLIMHMATEDQFVSKETQQIIHSELDDHPLIKLYDYKEDHAFARKGGDSYKEESAKIAQARSLSFLEHNLLKDIK